MENQESNLQSLSIEQIDKLIEKTKQEIEQLNDAIKQKQEYLSNLLIQINNQ
ncbi:MAG: DUF1192 family protein [Bacilli bacterium]|nr:DUF1192 family protein [Bacilli bacterium]